MPAGDFMNDKQPQSTSTSNKRQITRRTIEQYQDKVKALVQQLLAPESIKQGYILAAGKLLFSFNLIDEAFPKKNVLPIAATATDTIYVLSLGSGLTPEYLALKVQYPNARIHFVGIDINAEQNKRISTYFVNFPDFTLLTADGSDFIEMTQLLKSRNIAPQGFSLIFLRQPDFLNKENQHIFLRMLCFTIPFLAEPNARIFISSYHEEESKAIRQLLHLNPQYYQPIIPKEEGLKFNRVYATRLDSGTELEPDSFIQFLDCKGIALKKFSHESKMLVLFTTHITKNSPIPIDWGFSNTSQALYVTHTNQTLLHSIKTYLEQYKIHSIQFGAVSKQPGKFCLQIWKTDTQVAQLEELPVMPANAFKLTPPAVTTVGFATDSIWSNVASSTAQTSTTNTSTTSEQSAQSTTTTLQPS